jgi:hypothetical protein
MKLSPTDRTISQGFRQQAIRQSTNEEHHMQDEDGNWNVTPEALLEAAGYVY